MRKLTIQEIINRLKNDVPTLKNVHELTDGNFSGTCMICGGHPVFSRKDAIYAKKRIPKCAVCHSIQIEKGINDIKTLYPEVAKYFTEEYANTHSICTAEKGLAKCPECKEYKWELPSKIKNRGYYCPFCNDGVSYPNRFIRALLQQLPIDNFKPEYILPSSNKKYDDYFEYNGNKYIIEVDGRQHFEDTEWSTYKEQYKNDKSKDELAKQYNIDVIRINCYYSDFEYIKNNVLNSKLKDIFDLSNINWDLCNKNSIKSLVILICEYYSTNLNSSIKDISDYFFIDRHTVIRYLKKGTELGLCNYNTEDSKRRARISNSRKNGHIIYVYDSQNNYIGSFESLLDCELYINNNYANVNVKKKVISEVLHKRQKSHKGFFFYYNRKEEIA